MGHLLNLDIQEALRQLCKSLAQTPQHINHKLTCLVMTPTKKEKITCTLSLELRMTVNNEVYCMFQKVADTKLETIMIILHKILAWKSCHDFMHGYQQ